MANHTSTARTDITGKIFNYLQAIEIDHVDKRITATGKVKYAVYWKCKCLLCGGTAIVARTELVSGKTKSCGCLRASVSGHTSKKSTSTHPLYKIHQAMIRRCYVPTAQHYELYGGRGIYISDEWYTPGVPGNPGFVAFYRWSYVNGYTDPPKGQKNPISIDRIDNDGPYAPWNCRWVDKKTQGENRVTNVYVTIDGGRNTISQLADKYGTTTKKLYRMHGEHNWSLNAIVHYLTHPELGLHKSTKTGYYMDSEGFMVLIPKTQEERI